MRVNLLLCALLSCVLILGLTSVAFADSRSASPAQQDTCSALVERALMAVGSNCGEMGRNTACYGYNRVNATFAQDMPSGFFSTPADITDLLSLRTLTTAPLDEGNDTWGVAVVKAQANLPAALPGQAVTFLLLGDAMVENAVASDGAFVPAAQLPVVTAGAVDLHSGAGLDSNIVASVGAGTPLTADAISADAGWVRAADATTGGWLPVTALQPVDLSSLSVLDDGQYAPMQAFYFQTGLDALSCIEAPNAVLVQGPQNFEIAINVNGAEVNINSTVQLISMPQAPERILTNLPLPPRVVRHLSQQYGKESNGEVCRIQHLRVISGHARLNNNTILPAGNAAWSAYCLQDVLEISFQSPALDFMQNLMKPFAQQPPPSEPPPVQSESVPGASSIADRTGAIAPNRQQIVSFISEWGAFRPVNEEELAAIQVLERLPASIMNYQIDLPELDEIQPPIVAGT